MAYAFGLQGRRVISSSRDQFGYALDPLGGGDRHRGLLPRWLVVAVLIAVVGVVAFAWRYSRTHDAEAMGLMRIDPSVTATDRSSVESRVRMRTATPAPPSETLPASVADAVAVAADLPGADDAVRFGHRTLRPVRTIRMVVTAYSPDARSCGKWADGITASGKSVWTNGMKLVAADTRLLPFGSIISVPGYNGGRPVPVLDRGGKIKGKRLDVLYPTHEIARRWGRQTLEVTVWEYAD